jgi:hypothetical protein
LCFGVIGFLWSSAELAIAPGRGGFLGAFDRAKRHGGGVFLLHDSTLSLTLGFRQQQRKSPQTFQPAGLSYELLQTV